MRLQLVAFSLTCGLIWSGAVLAVGVAHAVWPDYGLSFLALIASIYPGYQPGPSVGAILVGAVYAFVDGAIGGAIFAWLYNLLSRHLPDSAS